MKNKITILVEKVDVDKYRALKKENIYPLIVEKSFLEIFNALDAKGYYKEDNLYKLKIEFLKEQFWRRTCQNKGFDCEKDIIDYNDGMKHEILAYLNESESPSKKDSIVISTDYGKDFITMEELYNRALGIKSLKIQKEVQNEDNEKVTIIQEVADFHSYNIMRANQTLPLVIILTEYENRVVSFPFDGLFIKTNLVQDNKIVLTLDLRRLKKMIAEGKIELAGIKLEDGKVHKVDSLFGGDYDSFGSFTIGERKEEIKELTKKLLKPKELKPIESETETKDNPYLF